jgi:hypothetical protein
MFSLFCIESAWDAGPVGGPDRLAWASLMVIAEEAVSGKLALGKIATAQKEIGRLPHQSGSHPNANSK